MCAMFCNFPVEKRRRSPYRTFICLPVALSHGAGRRECPPLFPACGEVFGNMLLALTLPRMRFFGGVSGLFAV